MEHLQKLGKNPVRLNTDTFTDEIRFDYRIEQSVPVLQIHTQDRSFSAHEVEAVWYRKTWDLNVPQDLDKQFVPIFHQEYLTMRTILFNALQHVPWINPIVTDHAIGNDKLQQLHIASACGLAIPETIFTNDYLKVQTFFHEACNGNMIAKLHGSLSRSMNGNTPFFPTTLITEKDLENLETLVYCPMIFQRMIEKAYELRIVYVDGCFFTGKIHAGHSQKGATDWRIANDIAFTWEKYTLPDAVETALTNMMERLGLAFGAIDMICNTNGTYVFLEINPQGEWGMLQRDLGYPIAETIAEKLISRIPASTSMTGKAIPVNQ
jgi:glutathione synthase/RimK-type ligase-like ATP-grasp enzyme